MSLSIHLPGAGTRPGRTALSALAMAAATMLLACAPAARRPAPEVSTRPTPAGDRYDAVITGGRIIDGTGAAWFYGDIGLRGDRIARMAPRGALSGATAARRIDARGLVVAPGFIDIQSHSRGALLDGDGRVVSKVTQGITTEILGEGWTNAPTNERTRALNAAADYAESRLDSIYGVKLSGRGGFGRWLEAMQQNGMSVNAGSFVGSATVRAYAMGAKQGAPSPAELDTMRAVVRDAMQSGAFGLATALIYPPDNFSTTEQLTELARTIAPYGGIYITHMRSEADQFLEALDEAIRIGRDGGVPVEVYHLKAAGRRNWPKIPAAIAKIDSAREAGIDVQANMYPYEAGGTALAACTPPWASADDRLLSNLRDPAVRAEIEAEIMEQGEPRAPWENLCQLATPEGVIVSGFDSPELEMFEGKSLASIAATRDQAWVDALIDLTLAENAQLGAMFFIASEENLVLQMRQPWIKFGTDASGIDPDSARYLAHPRAYGTFPRILGRYVRDQGVMPLEEAIRKMTSAVAIRLSLQERGLVREGFYADLVVFDPDIIADRATYDRPHQLSVGVRHVFVNGAAVVSEGTHTGAKPGRLVRGPGAGMTLPAAAGTQGETASRATLIDNAMLIDGTGSVARPASVRIVGDRITAVGDLQRAEGDEVFDAHGLTLTPGFIDTHSHADGDIADHRDALAHVSQGITTAIVGQDGGSADTLAKFFTRLERLPGALNFASYVGHNTVRYQVMGENYRREATPAEIGRMKSLVAEGMRAGALGLSTGLEYDPGIYSSRAEVIELATVAAQFGGRYISHMRSEDRALWAAVDELLEVGRSAGLPVQISHAKLAMRDLWGQADSLISVLDRARRSGTDVTLDIYPYPYWQSSLTVLFPERNFGDNPEALAAARFALDQLAPADGMLLSRYAPNPAYVGMTIADVARERGTDPAHTYLALIREAEALRADSARRRALAPDGAVEMVIGTSMDERDIERLLQWPFANIASDGGLVDRHPRGSGAFPRVLARYVRERQVLSLPEAIRKMTSLAARNVGIRDRGTVAPGQYADLVLLDPARVLDRATPAEPHLLSTGIARVWVNGEVVFEDGRSTGRHPGMVIRRAPGGAR